ncbi:MAG: hypothetical protein AAF600_13360 [Bacteroidota bacterium]
MTGTCYIKKAISQIKSVYLPILFARERYWFRTNSKIKASSFSPTVHQVQTIPTPTTHEPVKQDKLKLSNPEEIAQKVKVTSSSSPRDKKHYGYDKKEVEEKLLDMLFDAL